MDVITHPFRIGADGAVVTASQGSDDSDASQLTMLVLTRRGERTLVPTLGVEDPVFHQLDPVDLGLQVDLFGPDVEIADVIETPVDPFTTRIEVVYE